MVIERRRQLNASMIVRIRNPTPRIHDKVVQDSIWKIARNLRFEDVRLLKFILGSEIIPDGEGERIETGKDLCNYLCKQYPIEYVTKLLHYFLPLIVRKDLLGDNNLLQGYDARNARRLQLPQPNQLRIMCYKVALEIDRASLNRLIKQLSPSVPPSIIEDLQESQCPLRCMQDLIESGLNRT